MVVELQRDFVLSFHGKLEWYLGCKIIQDMERGTVTINQEKYANDVLYRFNMQEGDKRDPVVIRDYQACVGSLMYLSVFTQGDYSFAINQTVRFLNNPGPTHITDVKRILRYIVERTDNQCRPDVRVCSPLLLYLFINPCTPTCSLAFSLDFLKSYLSFRTYSRRVSHQGGHRPLSLPPSTSQAPSLEEHIAKGQEEKGR